MFKIIYGVAGVGKTLQLNKMMKESLKNGKKVILIVPEQFSFETEANMIDELTNGEFFDLSVLNFSRLCDKIFEFYGGVQGLTISTSKKILYLIKAILTLKDALKIYKNQNLSKTFISDLCATIDEIKNNNLQPGFYNLINFDDYNDILSQKIHDIDLIYTYYKSFTEEFSPDCADKIAIATNILNKTDINFFENTDVFFDVFSGFTSIQYEMLKVIFKNANDIVVSLCCDKILGKTPIDKYSFFSGIYDQGRNLIEIAKSQNLKIATPQQIQDNTRFENQQLIFLENNFLKTNKKTYDTIPENIFVNYFENVYKESEYICAKISNYVKTENYRFKDFIIITRNLNETYDIYINAFKKYEIPYFLDKKEPVAHKAIFTFILSLFNVINYGFRTDDILSLVKTGAFGIDYKKIAQLENYCYIWNIDKSVWKNEFIFNPEGLTGEISEQSKNDLIQINETRETIIKPILEFIKQIKSNENAKQICMSIYDFLNKIKCYENINEQNIQKEQKATNLRVYNTFLILLEEISDSLDDLKIDLKIFGQMLNITASYCDLGEIPNGIDQVIIGQADRIRADGRKCCFISGLNQGVFPPDNFKNGVLSSKEKEKLIEKGINLNHDDFYLSSMEDFYAYCAITAPKNILFLTYPLADRNFNKLFPSPYINQIKDIFPKIEMKNILAFDDLILAQNKKTLLSLYATNLNKANNKSNELKNCINGFKEIENLFSEIDNAVVTKPFKIEEKEVIHKLFGDNLKISASKIERFKICRFAYFLEYAIKIKKIQKAEITPLESGSIIHFVLSEFISKKTKEEIIGIEKKDIKQEIKKITLQYCSNYIGNEENLSEKQKVIIKRIIDAICDIIIIISKEFEQSEFTPIDYEMKIDENTEIKPLILQSINGEKISVEGVIDRVDSFEKNGIKYIRIIDYKSGKKDFKLKEVFYGLNLQMLIYLITIWKNGKEKYGNIMPSGILYFPAKQNFAVVDKIDKEKALDNNLKNYKMSGLIIDDIEIINAMEKDIKGVFIPVKKGKDGLSKNSSVASLEELGKLRTYIEKQIINMADEIYAGEINAKVCKDNDKTPCDYCSYYKICLNENSENSIDIEDINKEEFFKLIDDK